MNAVLIFYNIDLACEIRECERGLPVHMNFRALAERIVIPPTWRSGTFPSHFVVNKSRRTRMDFKYDHRKIEMVVSEYIKKLGKISAVQKYFKECYVDIMLINNIL